MSGCGRKHRAKHITTMYLDDSAWTGLLGDEFLGVCMESPHDKHVRVWVLQKEEEFEAKLLKVRERLAEEASVVPEKLEEIPATVVVTGEEVRSAKKRIHREHVPAGSALGSGVGKRGDGEHSIDPAVLQTLDVVRVHLPGKFTKVLWLGLSDIIVVRDGQVHHRPSPRQISMFLSSEEGHTYLAAIRAVGGKVGEFTEVAEEEVAGDEEDELDKMINANRNTIKHKTSTFLVEEDDDDDEEEEEGEEEEGEEEEDQEEDEVTE